jgi:hypothetical protein
MKVLNLQCEHQHSFEGWFASEDDFVQQLDRGLLTCPVCGSATVHKTLSAPRLNLKSSRTREPQAPAKADATPVSHVPAQLQAQWLQAVRTLMANTEDVGERFATEVRAMHYGDAEERAVRGQATPQQAMELIEEGIEVLPLPALDVFKEPLQ